MATASDVSMWFAFNRWANALLLEAAASVPAECLEIDLRASHRSLHGTLLHTLWGEWIWSRRWRGESPRTTFDVSDFPDVPALRELWSSVEEDQQTFISALTDEALKQPVSYENLEGQRWEYPLGDMLHHVFNHSSYHRGQAATLLRQLGRTPPPTDFLVFIDEQRRAS